MGFLKTPQEASEERRVRMEYGLENPEQIETKDRTWLDAFLEYLKEAKERDRQRIGAVV